METFINKVAESGIVTLDLAPFVLDSEVALFDLKPFLFREMILREKDYRASLAQQDWLVYQGKHVAITCSADAIIPVWAYMLATTYLGPVAKSVYLGTVPEYEKVLLCERIRQVDETQYAAKRVVIKGCGDLPIPDAAYVAITEKLLPVVKSLMYGEPCSTVPIYKSKI